MRRFHILAILALLIAAAIPAHAASDSADAPHVQVRLVVVPQALAQGQSAHAGLYFKLEQGWHVYWQNAGDAGEPPHMHWALPAGITAGPLQFPAPQRLPLGPLMDYGYEDEVLFPFSIDVAKTAKTGTAVLHAKVDWLVCRATCIPGKAELEVTRNVAVQAQSAPGPDAALYDRFEERLPKSMPAGYRADFALTQQGFALQVKTGQRETEAAFFPADQGILDNPAPQPLTPLKDGALVLLRKDAGLTANPAELKGVLELSGGRAFILSAKPGEIDAALLRSAVATGATATRQVASTLETSAPTMPAEQTPPSRSNPLWKVSFLAFLGGVLLNLMPCVFPVLFLKGLALVRSGSEERHVLRRHGFVYTAGIVVSFWVLVGVLLSLRAAGSVLGWGFQFQSPVFLELMAALLFFLGLSLAGQFEMGLSLTSAGGSLAAQHGYAGSFFTGVLAVIVATPCTGPFMAAAIGYALAQPAAVTFAVFTALALGLAAPYVALTLQPAWTRVLPRPGAWMDVLKQATAVPIFAFVIWLAWVLAQAYGAALLAVLLMCFLLLAIAGWFLGRWQTRRWATVVAGLLVLAVVLLSIYAPQKLASETAPSAQSTGKAGWEPWSPDAVRRYQSEGRPVFVDFTASWCLSCQVNERVALDQPEVQQAFAEHHVALLRADWTRHDEAITQALTTLGRDGVPAYVLYVPGQSSPMILPQVLTPGIVMDALSELPQRGSSIQK
ncbi:MAG: thioredoxin family protein [Terracidiphilus sp.]